MKKILITGYGSYVGKSFKQHLDKLDSSYECSFMDLRDISWKNEKFSQYDVIYHVAGIAHSDSNKLSEEKKALYYEVNTDLAIETAIKAKKEGIKQFILMSSIVVYGDGAELGASNLINEKTTPKPANIYGDSKFKAEEGLLKLSDKNFRVCVIRSPMIYGEISKGNYPVLSKWALKLPLFPDIDNKRSMIYIENICEFVRLLIENEDSGTFFPQNDEYVKTSQMVKVIAAVHGKKIKLTKFFNPILKLFGKKSGLVRKVFGNFAYEKSMSVYKHKYNLVDFEESIRRSEKINEE